jgi:hypothetical protein
MFLEPSAIVLTLGWLPMWTCRPVIVQRNVRKQPGLPPAIHRVSRYALRLW